MYLGLRFTNSKILTITVHHFLMQHYLANASSENKISNSYVITDDRYYVTYLFLLYVYVFLLYVYIYSSCQLELFGYPD